MKHKLVVTFSSERNNRISRAIGFSGIRTPKNGIVSYPSLRKGNFELTIIRDHDDGYLAVYTGDLHKSSGKPWADGAYENRISKITLIAIPDIKQDLAKIGLGPSQIARCAGKAPIKHREAVLDVIEKHGVPIRAMLNC